MYTRRWRETPAGVWRDFDAMRRRWRIWARATGATAADALIWFLVFGAGLMVWAPSQGLAAANETVEARFRQRMRVETLRILGGPVWSRHARREPLPGAVRLIDRVDIIR